MSLEHPALKAFHFAARRVPAYRDFLARRGVDPATVRTLGDFARVPATDKKNYLTAYPLDALCVDGDLGRAHTVCVTSGSTGAQVSIPMAPAQEDRIAPGLERLFIERFEARGRRTLVVVTFFLGTTSAGMLASRACVALARRPDLKMTVMTPGLDADESLRVIRALGPLYDQVVVLGYPMFVRSLLERGQSEGLDWAALRPGLVTAGEGFSEAWRDRAMALIGTDEPANVVSLLGTSEAGVLAAETVETIRIRRAATTEPRLARRLFGQSGPPPMLMAYDPAARYVESVGGELHLTVADQAAPLIRYNLRDRGGLLSTDALPPALAPGRPTHFIYLFGRADAAFVCGVTVYIEHVAAALETPGIAGATSRRFKVAVHESETGDQTLVVDIELAPGRRPSPALSEAVQAALVETLYRVNREFRIVHGLEGETIGPIVRLRPHGGPGMQLEPSGKWRTLDPRILQSRRASTDPIP